ncbi:MAG: hypothetical protein BalsKO_04400 [Balneolaceae bacterium]
MKYREEVVQLLPASISSISVQKKNTFRFSIFVEEQFLIGVSDSTLNKLNLSKGVLLTPSLLDEIVEKENNWAIREYFFRLLGRRDHTRNELRDKAKKKDFHSESIEQILNEFTEKKYINNLSFARKFVRDKFEFNKWGANKIRSELFKKGVSEKEITIALQEIDSKDNIETIKNLIKKNKRKFQRADSSKRKKKIFDFLLRKGYDLNTILKRMPTLLAIIEK